MEREGIRPKTRMNTYQAIRRNKVHNNCVHSVRYFETDWTSESGIVVELYSPIQVAGFSSSHDLPQDARCNTIVVVSRLLYAHYGIRADIHF